MGDPLRVAVLAPFVGGAYYGELIHGVAQAAVEAGWGVLAVQTVPAGSHDPNHNGTPDLRVPVAWDRYDAAVGLIGGLDVEYARMLLDGAGTPLVLVSHQLPGVDCATVSADASIGVRESVRHLVEHGHRRIGFAGDLTYADVRVRHDSFLAEMAALGLEVHPDDVLLLAGNHRRGGEQAAAALLERGLPVTAMVLGTDRNALGLLDTLAAAGVRVPDDLAVVGFDDIVDARYSTPALATVSQSFPDLGAAAFALVRALREGLADASPPVPTTFVPRASCGCGSEAAGAADATAEARRQYDRSRAIDDVLHVQYRLGIDLFHTRHEHRDLRDLDWLRATPVRGGVLGLWPAAASSLQGTSAAWDASAPAGSSPAPGAAGQELEIVGGFLVDGPSPAAPGATVAVGEFPPAGLIDAADDARGEILFVVPVRSLITDWGFLAAVSEIQSVTPPGRELMNDSVALLAVALDQAAMVAALRRQHELVREAALRDHLTGLPNRLVLEERLAQATLRAGRGEAAPGSSVALLFLDLNDFKIVNDSLGHAAGDQLLKEVAARLAEVTRKGDLAARWGGDEFVVLLEEIVSDAEVRSAVERIHAALAAPVHLAGHPEPVTVRASIGTAWTRLDALDPQALLHRADAAMYAAKTGLA
jgi:diguanylate cyclase (GGDEF)-like protein